MFNYRGEPLFFNITQKESRPQSAQRVKLHLRQSCSVFRVAGRMDTIKKPMQGLAVLGMCLIWISMKGIKKAIFSLSVWGNNIVQCPFCRRVKWHCTGLNNYVSKHVDKFRDISALSSKPFPPIPVLLQCLVFLSQTSKQKQVTCSLLPQHSNERFWHLTTVMSSN